MVDRVVLHIGTMKSGTSYLQRGLSTGILESDGAFYAGGSFGMQTRAVASMLRQTEKRRPQTWNKLSARVRRRDGVAVYSHEFLSFAPRRRVREIVNSFGGAPVDVLLTVRDQQAAMPAQWQSFVRNRGTDDWATYVRSLDGLRADAPGRSGRTRAVRSFLRAQDVPGILARWTGHAGVSSVGLVVVPGPGTPPERLWQRFCEAARIGVAEPPDADTRLNESLGYASCDVIRRLNGSLSGLTRKEHERARKAAVRALIPLRAAEHRPVLDRSGAALARDLNKRILDAVDRYGLRFVGSRGELPVAESGEEPPSMPAPDPAHLRRAFETAWGCCAPGVPPPSGDLDDGIADLGRRLSVRFGD